MFKAVVETIETLPATVDWLEIRQAGAINALKHRMIDSDDDEGDQQSWYSDSDAGMDDADPIDEERLAARSEVAKQNTFAALLSAIPDRIRRLSFLSELSEVDPDAPSADKDEQIQLVAALKRPSFLPNLVQLEVANPCKNEWFDDWDKEDHKWIRARQRPLAAVAKKRGIFLGPRDCEWQQLAQEGTQIPRYFV